MPGGNRRFRAGAPPREATSWGTTALLVALLLVATSWMTLRGVQGALAELKVDSVYTDALLVVLGIGACALLLPALRSLKIAREGGAALAAGDVIAARVAAAQAQPRLVHLRLRRRPGAALVVVQFLIANHLAVSRTFFLLPSSPAPSGSSSRPLDQHLHLLRGRGAGACLGLVIAVARLAPGAAGKPIRAIATLCRCLPRLPAIINIYLIGFGVPLTGLPILKDMSQDTFCILALTLTYGAYVAEVYRSGIESIHWSQTGRPLPRPFLSPDARFVIVPQAVRRIIPPLLNDFIGLQKERPWSMSSAPSMPSTRPRSWPAIISTCPR
jgi:polar amino acid transport system permease protein